MNQVNDLKPHVLDPDKRIFLKPYLNEQHCEETEYQETASKTHFARWLIS